MLGRIEVHDPRSRSYPVTMSTELIRPVCEDCGHRHLTCVCDECLGGLCHLGDTTMPQLGATMKDIERLERQIKEVREAVLAMAIALGAALLGTGDTTRTLNALMATQGEIGTGQETP